ncbi:acyclic terpene utilization AtuA family protein [Achromobacter denitrificans]|uniref:acyclic terpene utilization AtuA family protein n=1 Tax=Achromobacter denitrificans TaxID=32002 RepID=UPI00242FDCDF|nr:acyclic terpene utilization AtuA family protein [Achromobacter denitrificans]MBV2157938.1 DUF1446 domain-containing protein [Achromobacter denitrificans]
MANPSPLLIGCAAGFSGDRLDAAAPVVQALVDSGRPGVLIFETLAERTLALAQLARRANPDAGYEPLLDELLRPVLAQCLQHGVRIVSNFGAANPRGAALRIQQLAAELGARRPRVAVVHGDDLSGAQHRAVLERALGPSMPAQPIVSANAYIGAEPIAQALRAGADIVVCGRVADPALVLGPALAHYGWCMDDWDRLARATMAGHLLECGAQVTGGYFGDPGYKDVPEPWNLAFPYADVDLDGTAEIGKVAGTGGSIDLRTVKEQMFYEVHDPARYITPDVVVDFTTARLEQVAQDRVRVSGISGHARTPTLKVSIGCTEGHIGEDMFFFAGPGCLEKARLAETILRERLRIAGLQAEDLRIDFIGVNAVHGAASAALREEPAEVAVRIAACCASRAQAEKIGREVDGMAVCGLASTGKRVPHQDRTREVIGLWSTLVPRERVACRVEFV